MARIVVARTRWALLGGLLGLVLLSAGWGAAGCLGVPLSVFSAHGRTEARGPTWTGLGLSAQTRSEVNWVEHTVRFDFDGQERQYLYYVPASRHPHETLPVVVELAGCCYSAQAESERANFRQVASPAVLVYPSYLRQHWDAGACCGAAAADHVDDVGFVSAVIDQVRAEVPGASSGPVYLAGYSNGAKLALELTCTRPDLVAAVAVYGGSLTYPCPNPPPASVLLMGGSADDQVRIYGGPPIVEGGFAEPSLSDLAQLYRTADACGPIEQLGFAGKASQTRWASCVGGRQVGLVVYQGYDHNWPEDAGSTLSAQQLMWDFFSDVGPGVRP